MTNEQAGNQLLDLQERSKEHIALESAPNDPWAEDIIALDIAIKALEKQIPKKPNKILQAFEYIFGDCPSCNKSSDMNYKHCQYCGQKLDWE
jgi:hypothetical protein